MIFFDISVLSIHRSTDQQTLDETSTNCVFISKHLPSLNLIVQTLFPVCFFKDSIGCVLLKIQIRSKIILWYWFPGNRWHLYLAFIIIITFVDKFRSVFCCSVLYYLDIHYNTLSFSTNAYHKWGNVLCLAFWRFEFCVIFVEK